MTGRATTPTAPAGRRHRGVRRPGSPQWTPLAAPGAGSSFRDLLGPADADAPVTRGPFAPVTQDPGPRSEFGAGPFGASPFAPAAPIDPEPAEPAPADDAPDDEPTTPSSSRRRRLAVPRLLNSRWALTAAGVVAVGAGLGGAAVMAHEPGQGAISPTTPEQCQAIQAAWTASASHQVGMTADDPVTLREGFMGARDALADAPVPSGVADDWALVTHYLDTVAAAVAEVVPTDGEAITAVVGATLADLNTPEVTAASARITTYLTGGCAG